MNPRYESDWDDWREEENERRQQQSRKHNLDPFYPDAYHRADTKPHLDFKTWLRRETGCHSRAEFYDERLSEGLTPAEGAACLRELYEEFIKAGGDPEDIE